VGSWEQSNNLTEFRVDLQILLTKLNQREILLCYQAIALAKLNEAVIRFTLSTTQAPAHVITVLKNRKYSHRFPFKGINANVKELIALQINITKNFNGSAFVVTPKDNSWSKKTHHTDVQTVKIGPFLQSSPTMLNPVYTIQPIVKPVVQPV